MEPVQQISIFAENKPGKIEVITKALTKEKINIRAITIASSNKYGIIKLLVDSPEKAYQVLKKEGLSVALNPTLALEIEDRPGGLHTIAQVVKKHQINIEDAYGFVIESKKKAVLVMQVKDIKKAQDILLSEKLHFLNSKELYEL